MAINRATFSITDGHLDQLVLEKGDLPPEFSGHQMAVSYTHLTLPTKA